MISNKESMDMYMYIKESLLCFYNKLDPIKVLKCMTVHLSSNIKILSFL